MNEAQVAQPEQVVATPPPSKPRDPLRRRTLAILILCVVLFGWTLIADRLTPYTSDASVRTFVVRIRPEVSGKVVEVAVHDNQTVRTGDLLYRIDPQPSAPMASRPWRHLPGDTACRSVSAASAHRARGC